MSGQFIPLIFSSVSIRVRQYTKDEDFNICGQKQNEILTVQVARDLFTLNKS